MEATKFSALVIRTAALLPSCLRRPLFHAVACGVIITLNRAEKSPYGPSIRACQKRSLIGWHGGNKILCVGNSHCCLASILFAKAAIPCSRLRSHYHAQSR